MERDTATYPWEEEALAVRPGADGFSEVAAEGTLLQIAYWLKEQPASALLVIRITLPNRGARPFGFRGSDFRDLLISAPWLAPDSRLAAR